MRKEKRNFDALDLEPSVNAVISQPQNALEQINKYGTYEVQDTTDTDNCR